MKPVELEKSFLLAQFHEFYREVVRQKTLILEHRQQIPAEVEGPFVAPGEENLVQTIQKRLMRLLEEQVLAARRHGGEYAVNYYRKAQYVMAALADDIFLHIAWEGKEYWKANLLEFKFFGSHVAGERFFAQIDALIEDRDPAMVEIAAVYLLALSLGFQGKFHGKENGDALAVYRRKLFAFIFKRHPDMEAEGRRLFDQAYGYTLDQGEGRRLPYIKRWAVLIGLIIVLFLAASHGLWQHSTRDLVEIASEIIQGGYTLK